MVMNELQITTPHVGGSALSWNWFFLLREEKRL